MSGAELGAKPVGTLEAVNSALKLSAPFLATDPALLPAQLVGRLISFSEPTLRGFLDHVCEEAPRPWLCPVTPALSPAGGPLEHVLINPGGRTDMVAVSADCRWIVATGEDGVVRVWSLGTGRLERVLVGHTGTVTSIAITADGARVVSGSQDRTVRVWTLGSGELEATLEGHDASVRGVVLTPDGERIVSGGDDGIAVWDLAKAQLERMWPTPTPAICLVVTPDGRRVISGSEDSTLQAWDLASGRPEQKYAASIWGYGYPVVPDNVASLSVTPDGTRIVCGGENARVWDLATGRLAATMGLSGGRRSDGSLVDSDRVSAVSLTPDGVRVVTGGERRTVRLWDLASGQQELALEGHTAWVGTVAVTQDGARIVSGGGDNTIRVWRLESPGSVCAPEGHAQGVRALAVTRDGTEIISGGKDNTIRVQDLSSERSQKSYGGHLDVVEAVAVSPDGAHIVSGGNNTVCIRDLGTGQKERTLEGHHASVKSVAVTPDGHWIVSGDDDNQVCVWDFVTGRLVRTLHARDIDTGWECPVAIAPDGARIVSGSGNTVLVWDLATGCLERTLAGHSNCVSAIAVTPDGSRIVSGSWDYTIRVWTLQDGSLERTLDVASSVKALAIATDGTWIASVGGGDRAMRVWSLQTGDLMASWTPDPGTGVEVCCIVPTDPGLIVYGDNLGGVHVLRLRLADGSRS